MEVKELKELILFIGKEQNQIKKDKEELRDALIDKFNPILLSLRAMLKGYSILNKENEDNSDKLRKLNQDVDDLTKEADSRCG